MAAKKILTIFGATGNQGGSVVESFLKDSKASAEWALRGVTRNTSSSKAQELTKKGVEVVSADVNDKASLVAAMKGASAVFAMTNYWDKADMKLEIQQGKNLADAAKEAGVDHFVWSSLLNVEKLSKGVLPHVYHFDSKAEVEEYVRKLGIPASFYLPAFFMSNLSTGMLHAEGETWTLRFPFAADAPIPLVDIGADTGKFVKAMVLKRDQVLGQHVLGAADYYTGNQILETFAKTFPETVKKTQFVHEDVATYRKSLQGPDFIQEEMLENMRLIGEFGYYGGAKLDKSHALVDEPLTTWADHIKKAKAYAEFK